MTRALKGILMGALIAGLCLVLAPASAQAGPGEAPTLAPASLPAAPDGYAVDAREAFRIARADPNVARVGAEREPLESRLEAKPPEKWQIGFFADGVEVAQVHVDSQTGEVLESWTGIQVAWQMARGYEEQFGHALNSPWVWIPMAAMFLFGLLDWRRPLRIVHLDLLVLLSFGISHVAFNDGEIGLSVPLAYPPLLYLLGRMLWIGFRGGGERSALRPSAPRLVLAIACIFLIAFRVTLNVIDSGVIDVGYAGVVGADRITQGEPIYGENAFPENNRTGDTYGPANYYAYVPFEAVWPWSGEWDSLPAAHAAVVFFDLATVLGLFVMGLRIAWGGRRDGNSFHPEQRTRISALGGVDWTLGVTLAFAWLAYPYTAFALQSNSNDSLVAAFLVWGLVALTSPVGRGALVGLAAMVKFVPLALVPLYLVGERGLTGRLRSRARRVGASELPEARRPGANQLRTRVSLLRGALIAVGAFAVTTALMLAHPAIDPGLATFYERTVESQLDRESPFSVWGQIDGFGWAQKLVLAGAAFIALAAALWPRERSTAQVAALGAAILIATQLAVDHWFYLYIPWFCGLVFVALAAPMRSAERSS